MGLLAACRVSARLQLLGDSSLPTRVAASIRRAGLATSDPTVAGDRLFDLDRWLRTAGVVERIGVDKKRTGPTIGFITVSEMGKCSRTLIALTELSRILRP